MAESFLVRKGTNSSSETQNAPSASQKDAAPRRNYKTEIHALTSPHSAKGCVSPTWDGGLGFCQEPQTAEDEGVASCHSTRPELMLSSHFFSYVTEGYQSWWGKEVWEWWGERAEWERALTQKMQGPGGKFQQCL